MSSCQHMPSVRTMVQIKIKRKGKRVRAKKGGRNGGRAARREEKSFIANNKKH